MAASDSPDRRLLVLYASQTGNAQVWVDPRQMSRGCLASAVPRCHHRRRRRQPCCRSTRFTFLPPNFTNTA